MENFHNWLKILQAFKAKNRFQTVSGLLPVQSVRERAVCLDRSFATQRWVDKFLDGTKPLFEP